MKRNFIYSKKSVRTFRLRIEPSFLSHAERGKTFWIREFLAGMRLGGRFAPPPFRLPIPIFNFGGGGEIRTHGALRHSCFQDRCTKPLCDASVYQSFFLNFSHPLRKSVLTSAQLFLATLKI